MTTAEQIDDGRNPQRSMLEPAAAGLAVAALLVAPLVGRGHLFALDYVSVPEPRIGGAMWGLGAELPRATPFAELGVVVSWFIGAPAAILVILTASIVGAYVGMFRLAPSTERLTCHAAAVLYAGGPFLATRFGVGHLSMVAALGVLPWVVRPLIDERTPFHGLLWRAAAMSLCASYGGLLAGMVMITGLAQAGPFTLALVRRAATVTGAWTLGQVLWLGPGLTLLVAGPDLDSAEAFGSGIDSVGDVIRLTVGQGFWQPRFQVGFDQPLVLTGLAAAAVLALAAVSLRHTVPGWLRKLRLAAIVTMALVVLDALPVTSSAYADVTTFGPLGVLREPQRYLALYHLWLGASVAVGLEAIRADVAPRWSSMAAPCALAVAIVLSIPGWWAADGRITAAQYPDGWATVRAQIEADPGTAVGLPWARYLNLSFADEQRILNPTPDYFSGDVLISGELGFSPGDSERIDDRQDATAAAVQRLEDGLPAAEELSALGVRWIILLHEAGYRRYDAISADPGLRVAFTDDDISLFEVSRTRPVDAYVDRRSFIAPLVRLSDDPGGSFPQDGRSGWVQGTQRIADAATADGSRWVWYWPAVLITVANGCLLGTLWHGRPRRHGVRGNLAAEVARRVTTP